MEDIKFIRRSGRGIRRLITLCGTVTQLLAEYDRHLDTGGGSDSDDSDDGDDNNDADGEDPDPYKREERKRRRNRDYQSFLALIKLIPSLKARVDSTREGSRIRMYYARLLEGANDARSDDVSRVKSGIASLLNNRRNAPPSPPLELYTRDGRGLQNDTTGRLLCPIKYNWDDLAVRAKVRDLVDGYNAFDSYWLRCLYEGEMGDPEDVEKGFLKSNLLVKTFQMIFTSPSSARGNLDAEETTVEPRVRKRRTPSKRPPVAEQLKMNGMVTPRAIAYVATQLHFALNDATNWVTCYNGFNYEEFYEFIIDFFEEDQTPEGKAAANELLDWWNRRVFPLSAATRAASFISVKRSSLALLRQQRRARACQV